MEGKRNFNVFVLSVILTVLLCACGELEFEESVQINMESSSLYQESEIQSALMYVLIILIQISLVVN